MNSLASSIVFLTVVISTTVVKARDVAILRPDVLDEREMRFSADEVKAIAFLRRYGYLPANANTRLPVTRPLFTNALNNYQVMASIPIKERLDRAAMDAMDGPRCANPDVHRSGGDVASFEIHAPRWKKGNLTWRISKYPTKYLTRPTIDLAMRQAMRMWSNISHIDFVQISDGSSSVDIDIKFENSNYDSSCDIYFKLGELAHATLTRSPAKVHFNGRVDWKVGVPTSDEVDLVSVAAHEIGHVLGLDHSSDRNALMFAKYQRQNSDLSRDDVQAIQYLYGSRRDGSQTPPPSSSRPSPTPRPRPSTPDLSEGSCPTAVTRRMPDGRRPMCAAVYKDSRCRGARLPIESGNRTPQLSDEWDNEISSAEINPGCTLKVCHRRYYTGGCHDLDGGTAGKNYIRLPLGFNEMVTSLTCICDEENENQDDDEVPGGEPTPTSTSRTTLERGREPPPFIPNTSQPTATCAVLASGWDSRSTRAWIEVETAMRMPGDLAGVTYAYMATRRGCTLFYCTKPAFGGTCEFLGPSRHAESDGGFEIQSLSCECK